MTDVMSLLSLPSSSAFSAIRTTIVDESAPRKVARLDTDSDSGSAFRSREGTHAVQRGPIRVTVTGNPVASRPQDTLLPALRRFIRVLLTRHSTENLPLSYECVYAACRHVVFVTGKGEGLADILKLELEKCSGRLQKELLDDRATGLRYFAPFAQGLTWFQERTRLLQDVLTYLDRVHLSSTSIRKLADDLLDSRIFHDPHFHGGFAGGIQEWLAAEREKGPHEVRVHIREVIRHLQAHGHYQGRFEALYLEDLQEFYTEEAEERAGPDADPLAFLTFCMVSITGEVARAKEVLPESSWGAVESAVEAGLLKDHQAWLAKGVIGPLVEQQDVANLATLNRLMDRTEGLTELTKAFKEFILRRVTETVIDSAHDDEMVERLLKFKAASDTALHDALVDDDDCPRKDFEYALIDAFATGFKARRNKPAEMIAKHVDRLMRKGQRGATDAEFEAQLDAALALYRFTDDKDVFRTFYHRALAKRLLLERSASDDFEKAILKKLKEQYDPEFSMGDHMFTDLALSRDTMREYHARLEGAQKLNVMVLQRSFWPFSSKPAEADLPGLMQDELTGFVEFYKEKHTGHRLEWNHALGTVSLKARFVGGQKELSVTLYQALVLLLFNEATELSFTEVKVNTRMEDGELRRTLQSLACGKKKVLKKQPVGKDIHEGDVFEFNGEFSDPRAKVHINSIQAKETPEESTRMQDAIEGDRKHYIDAAIVRIMKSRKQLHYEQIKTETIAAVKKHFVPDITSIKQRVDSLVEQEYLRRDEEDRNLFFYVA